MHISNVTNKCMNTEIQYRGCPTGVNVSKMLTAALSCNVHGLEPAEKITDHLQNIIYSCLGNKNATFEDLYNIKKTHLIISGTCLTSQNIEYFTINLAFIT